jgi:hypothetical protein
VLFRPAVLSPFIGRNRSRLCRAAPSIPLSPSIAVPKGPGARALQSMAIVVAVCGLLFMLWVDWNVGMWTGLDV